MAANNDQAPSAGEASPADGAAAIAARAGRPGRGGLRPPGWLALAFLLPALLILGALVLYPILYSIGRSLFDASGTRFVGLGNYVDMFTDRATLTAIRNNAIWVAVAPTLVTGLGLIFAVLTERVRWATAFKLLIFMPMAISFLAAGIIFRLVYEQDPQRGVANAILVAVHDTFAESSKYPGARPRDTRLLVKQADGSYATGTALRTGSTVQFGLVGVAPTKLPEEARPAAAPPSAGNGQLAGTVWLDFALGGGGRPGQIDPREKGMPGVKVEAIRDGKVVDTAETGPNGEFRFSGLPDGGYTLRLAASNFAPPYNGLSWLGPMLITPAIISAYVWMWAGFAMVLIAAGLSAIPRDVLEAARVDGATEWQVFRRVTMPLLAPVLVVVFVTLVINVLKIFDLVYIIAPGSVQQDANVLALQMWLVSFGGGNNQGLGSAIAVFLFLLVVPAMLFNIRRFRRESR
ncbi:ABC transporter permease [Carbonactinospora thermoautotrophica]|uniref:ABC transporter permease n=1 Tax=Carbonactinospora thermoautotrophica TaxID=1469144 RepID=UPI0008338DD5|nr:ABC transporter permease subunit [Carbonactinospora thermoautotrophica]